MSAVTTLPFHRPLTRADLEDVPDDGHRYELIDGVLLVNVVETGRGKRPVFSLGLDLGREQAPPQKVPPSRVPAPG